MLFIVPAVAGLMVKVPVPVGAIEIDALAGFILNAPSSVKLTAPPPPHCKQLLPLAVLNPPPAEVVASRNGLASLVLPVTTVPVIGPGDVNVPVESAKLQVLFTAPVVPVLILTRPSRKELTFVPLANDKSN